jgi:lambda repressor-like predicted transcriptional regulator
MRKRGWCLEELVQRHEYDQNTLHKNVEELIIKVRKIIFNVIFII